MSLSKSGEFSRKQNILEKYEYGALNNFYEQLKDKYEGLGGDNVANKKSKKDLQITVDLIGFPSDKEANDFKNILQGIIGKSKFSGKNEEDKDEFGCLELSTWKAKSGKGRDVETLCFDIKQIPMKDLKPTNMLTIEAEKVRQEQIRERVF